MTASDGRACVMLALLVGGCTASGASDVGVDVGVDTGVDVGVDAGRDAGIDASADVGSDALLDGGWIPLADVPDGCVLLTASPALVAATSFPVEPCPDRNGCRRITSFEGPPGSHQFLVQDRQGAHNGTRGLAVLFGDLGNGYEDAWVTDDVGHAVAGFRTNSLVVSEDSCSQAEFDVSPSYFGVVLQRIVHPADIGEFLYRGPIGTVPVFVADLRAPFAHGGVQAIRLDGPRTAAWFGTQIVEAAESDGSLHTIAPIAGGGGCEIADVVGDAIFAECTGPTNVFVQLPGGPLTRLFAASQINYGLESDGTDMAWLRYSFAGMDGGFTAQLWAAPHTTDPASIRERLVATLPRTTAIPVDLRLGNGYAAVAESSNMLGVYRLSDGARAPLPAPTGENWVGYVQYIGPQEIAATSGMPHVAPSTDTALMFIRLDSLAFVPP